MNKPIHTPGPVRVFSPFGRPEIVTDRPTAHETQSVVVQFGQPNADTNARFIAAAYNAFDSAARALNCNAVELAERMQDGGIRELIDALESAQDLVGKLALLVNNDLDASSAYEREFGGGVLGSYQNEFEAALAKVKGGAS